ncbi:hypothetical protein, partial [Bradyrhizobium sp. Leo121]|uniref:hypothetical protein n=1 Tax=Bradyrhizobium sp. Leo121 TaxID=1571195 RepID=UPI001A90CE72
WFTAYFVLSLVTGLSCHHHPRQFLLLASLAPASGCQDHTTSPSVMRVLVSHTHRVHRISPQRS